MRERSHQKKAGDQIIVSRISILFFYTLIMEVLLWGITAVYHNYGLIFYRFLPYALPILGGLGLAAILFLTLRHSYQGDPRKEKLFSRSFLIYLLIAPTAITLLPWLFNLLPWMGAFNLGAKCVGIMLAGYFIAYPLYLKLRPDTAVLTWQSALLAALLYFFYSRFLDGKRYFINSGSYKDLPVPVQAIIFCAIALLIWGGCLLLGKVYKRLAVKPIALLLPVAFALAGILATGLADSMLAAADQRLILSIAGGLVLLCPLVYAFLVKKKKI